jgi:RNA polymerase sigma-70 factor (ECF subfamily)
MELCTEATSLGSPEWLTALKAGAPQGDARIAELRRFLVAALRTALAGNAAAGEAFIEDIAQESTLRILERIDSFEGRSRFTTWATTVAVRIAYTELRRARWRDVSLDEFVEAGVDGTSLADRLDSGATAPAERPDAQAHCDSVLLILRRVMQTDLSERQRTGLLAQMDGMAMIALAEKMETNTSALYKMLHDARKKLRAGLEREGITLDDVRNFLVTASNP